MVRRRVRREPVAYILGSKGFRRIELAVDPRVLIPRPETELLVELALELEPATVLDVGTGSGAIALALADELPNAAITATDTSLDALAVAQANRERLGFGERVRLAYGSLRAVVRSTSWSPTSRTSARASGRAWRPRSASTSRARRWSAARPGSRRSRRCSPRSRSRTSRRGAIGLEVGHRPGADRRRARCAAPATTGSRSARTSRGSTGWWSGGSESASLDAVRARRAGWPLFPADGLYGLACDPTRRGGDRAHPRDQGTRRRQAVRGHVLLAAGDARGRRGARAAHPRRARRPAARAGDPRGRQPRAALPARLPRGPGAARAAADRRAARRRGWRRSSRPRPTARASRRRRASRTSTPGSSPPSTWRSTAGELTGMPSTVVDVTAIEDGGEPVILREGALSSRGSPAAARAASSRVKKLSR